jgi:23S rRNA (cytosine1962-C5)-methyltransferase
MTFAASIARAAARRAPLLASTQCFRVFSGKAEGQDGVFIDVFGPLATLMVYEDPATASLDPKELADAALPALAPLGVQAIYFKPFAKDRSRLGGSLPKVVTSPTPLAGTRLPESIVVREHNVQLEVRPYDGLSTGLFVDQRDNRAWLAKLVANRVAKLTKAKDGTNARVRAALKDSPVDQPAPQHISVLNAFAYTCAFSTACAKAGAITTSVDVSAKYLAWGKANFAHNALDASAHRFARMDIFEFITYAKRKELRYDMVILDPPSFASANRKKGTKAWSSISDYPALVREVKGLLRPNALLFASTNTLELCQDGRLAKVVLKGLGGQPRMWLDVPEPGVDVAMSKGRFAALAAIV